MDLGAAGPDAPALHTVHPIERLGGADKHFLWVTAAQLAGAAIRARIDNADAPAGASAPTGYPRRGRSSSDHDEVKGFFQGHPQCGKNKKLSTLNVDVAPVFGNRYCSPRQLLLEPNGASIMPNYPLTGYRAF